jgi:hypothetical protein
VEIRNDLSDLVVVADESVTGCLVATVEDIEGERIRLALGDLHFDGRCAVSCLVVPRVGDVVSVVSRQGRHYVTAILERAEPGELELFSQRPIAIRSAGDVRVRAATSLELDAGDRIRFRSPLLEAMVGRLAAFAKAVRVTTGEALLHSKLARLCAELIDVAAQRIGVSAEHSHRQIDGTEQVRCRHFDLRATDVAHLRAQTTLVKAKDLVKVDAAQIQLG